MTWKRYDIPVYQILIRLWFQSFTAILRIFLHTNASYLPISLCPAIGRWRRTWNTCHHTHIRFRPEQYTRARDCTLGPACCNNDVVVETVNHEIRNERFFRPKWLCIEKQAQNPPTCRASTSLVTHNHSTLWHTIMAFHDSQTSSSITQNIALYDSKTSLFMTRKHRPWSTNVAFYDSKRFLFITHKHRIS